MTLGEVLPSHLRPRGSMLCEIHRRQRPGGWSPGGALYELCGSFYMDVARRVQTEISSLEACGLQRQEGGAGASRGPAGGLTAGLGRTQERAGLCRQPGATSHLKLWVPGPGCAVLMAVVLLRRVLLPRPPRPTETC